MKLTTIAFKNLKKNFSFYSLYMFSVSFVLMIFFSFISFSRNEVIMERISSDGRVETMSQTIGIFVMIFIIFYMSYSNNFFMRRRMKELGVYALLGYRKSTILKLLTIENIFVCMGGLIIGIFTGSLLHKWLTSAITFLLGLTINLSEIPFINPDAVLFSLFFVIAVLFALFLSNAKLLLKSTLLDLVRLEKKKEKPIRIRPLLAIIGIFSILSGYMLSLDITRGKTSVWYTIGFSPIALLTMLCVILGTIFFIYSFMPFMGHLIKKKKSSLYQETTIIVLPKFMHRIRSNAKSTILLILLSAGTLSIFGATILSTWYPIEALERIIPADIEFRVESSEQVEQTISTLNQTIGMENYKAHVTHILKTTAISQQLPYEYNISVDKGRTPGFECISEADYISLMDVQDKQVSLNPLSDTEAILIKYRPDIENTDVGMTYTLSLSDEESANVVVRETTLQNPIGFSNSVGTLVISNNLYKKMQHYNINSIDVMSVSGEDMRTSEIAYESIRALMPNNQYLVSAFQRQNELVHDNSSTFLLICFITIIFLIATGSILYFQNISSVTYDKDDYDILSKMGYNNTKIKRLIRRQVQINFLIPYAIGLLHSIFAIICYKSALMDDLLGRSNAVILPIMVSIVLFSIIYTVYYEITKHSCYRIALK